MSYLNVISASSIQDFINTSQNAVELKRSSDHVAGLMKELFDRIQERHGYKVIYPQSSDFAIGNTIIFISEEEIELIKDSEMPIEFFQTSVEYNEKEYNKCYEKLMLKLAAQKTNRCRRLFKKQDINYKYCEKCQKFHNFSDGNCNFWNKNSKKEEISFSTVHYAIGDFIKESNYEKITEFIILMNKEEKQNEEFLNKLVANKVSVSDIKDKGIEDKEIEEFINYVKNTPLTKYLTIYRLDIDNMGKKLGQLDKDEQIKLSEDIVTFMKKTENEINGNSKLYRKIIYIGGDDLLALLPVEYSLKLGQEIEKLFKENITSKHKKLDLTYTQGIFVIGSKNDFSECLRNSVRLMDKTKNYGDKEKNYTLISIITEGYANRELYIKNELYNDFILSRKYFFEESSDILQDLDKNFGCILKNINEEIYEDSNIKGIIENEQLRLLRRKYKCGSWDGKNEKIQLENERLKKILFMRENRKLRLNYNNYISYLSIIKFLNKRKEKNNEIDENNS